MLSDTKIQALKEKLRGQLIQPGDPDYEEARKVYNGMIDRHPRLIARCQDVADVMASVQFARDNALLLAIRGGGHNAGGLGVCDDGLVCDLSRMRGIRVNPKARTVQVEGGAVWSDVDHATHAFGMATPSGIIASTGVAGLALGGGSGYLTRKYGLTIDNLLSADMVLADGRFVTVSENEYPDLFWAIRGGGGNFGVVTSFEFRLHPVRNVIAGPTFWPLSRSEEILQWYRDFIRSAPEEMYGFFAFLAVPPAPYFPEDLRGEKVCAVIWCYLGSQRQADQAFEPVRRLGPTFFGVQEMSFPDLQSSFDVFYPPGLQWYWRADFVKEIPDEAVSVHARYGEQLPSSLSTMHLYPIDGAAHRVGKTDTAFYYRDANFSEVIVGVDPDPKNKDAIVSWTKEYWSALHPYSAGGAYINFLMHDEGHERIKATYQENYPRLVEVKDKYDPQNFFRVNQNIKPTPRS